VFSNYRKAMKILLDNFPCRTYNQKEGTKDTYDKKKTDKMGE